MAKTVAVSVKIDPFEGAVPEERFTDHLTSQYDGKEDNGEWLMGVFTTSRATGSLTPDGQLEAFQLCSENPQTLAEVPYQFLRVEMDTRKFVPKRKNKNMAGRTGLLADYFDQDATAPAWSHPNQLASFDEDFPYSVSNFNCDSLVADLEDDNHLVDLWRSVQWVLWMGIATAPEPNATADDVTTGHTTAGDAIADDATDGNAPIADFISRKRIFRVRDLLEQLHEVRSSLKHPVPGSAKPIVVVFIVAVSYAGLFCKPCVLPASSAPAASPDPPVSPADTEMMIPTRIEDAANAYMKRLFDKWPLSKISDLDICTTDSDRESNSSSIPPYDGPDPNAEECFYTEDGLFVVVEENAPMDSAPKNKTKPKKSAEEEHQSIRAFVRKFKLENLEKIMEENHREEPDQISRLFSGDDSCSEDLSSWESIHSSEGFSSRENFFRDDLFNKNTTSEDKDKQPETSLELTSGRPATPPARSIFETLDTNAAKGDAIEGDLHALLPDADSPSEEEWQACCALICIDPNAHRDARALSVKVPGTDNMWIKPSQLWTAYWMLASRTERGLCGGVLADVMGTGKTYVCLLVCLLRAYIGYNRAEVEREWQLREHESKKGTGSGKTTPKQHLPKDAGDGNTSIPCTCGNAMGIECYANPGGVTRRLADSLSRGASLILAPQTVLDNWVKTVKLVRLQPKYYEPVVFHGKMAKEDTVLAPAPRLRQKLAMEVRPLPSVSSTGLFPQTWQPNVLEAVHEFKPSVAKDAYPERFILLATHMPEKLTEFFQVPVPLRRKDGTSTRERKTIYSCPISIQIVDEFHKAKDDAVALALQHKHMRSSGTAGDDFDFWAITGTPLPAKLTDLETVTSLVQRLPEWNEPSSRHYDGRVEALHELQLAYEKAVATDGTPVQAADFRDRAERFFRCGLIKRHTEVSTFFGRRIFNLQDVPVKLVVNATPTAFREDVGQVVAQVGAELRKCMAGAETALQTTGGQPNWDQTVRSSSLFNLMMDLEILATFPGAARLMLTEPPKIDFGLTALRAEIRKAKNRDVAEVVLFQQHLDAVMEDSPHLKTILATLDEMARDRQKRKLAAPVDGEPSSSKSALPSRKKPDASLKKLVVLCPRMGEAVFVYLALRKLRPDARAVFVHFDLKMSERAALLRDFNRLDTGPGSRTPRVLVGTFRDAGTGNDLTVANYQILTGPLRLHSQQDQAFGRTNREGQTLRLHHRLLLTEDSPVDRIVMATQARRRIVSDPFSMNEALRLEEAEA